ncbi:UNVERIFIED_CONTAM: hypothetical protein Slati_0130600 [Sesamum latifolium]|uniref:Reverse transcriptase zinc-binding domain-containing protein n=1 Tax=Sesamum latifolium TaxID=2727402 RepID=A0AAW2Y9I1_9LAMI
MLGYHIFSPTIHGGDDRISWRVEGGQFSNQEAYALFHPPGPKLGWSSLLLGPLKIPRNNFILWLAILGKLSTLDKSWLNHLDGTCILCSNGQPETHAYLFFNCPYSRMCINVIRQHVRFPLPHHDWLTGVHWAAVKWRRKHVINASYRTLLASTVYHLWQERNKRIFQHTDQSAHTLACINVEECKQRIISANLPSSVSTIALFRLWKIHWTST